MEIGPSGMGDYARSQLKAIKRDPRLQRGPEAIIADYLDYLDEADRVRAFAIGSMETARHADELVADDLSLDYYTRQAAWERQEVAALEARRGHPHLNGITLIGMFGNLDGLVEQLVPSARELIVNAHVAAAMRNAADKVPDASRLLGEHAATIQEVLQKAISEKLPKIAKLRDVGPERWERVLAAAGLAAPPDRPLPPSLADALAELSALRDVLVHRAGRVDRRALQKCSRLETHLHLRSGDFARIDGQGYRRYSAALRCYGGEVLRRVMARAGIEIDVRLDAWEDFYYVSG